MRRRRISYGLEARVSEDRCSASLSGRCPRKLVWTMTVPSTSSRGRRVYIVYSDDVSSPTCWPQVVRVHMPSKMFKHSDVGEEDEGFHAALAAKLIKKCQYEGAEHIYLTRPSPPLFV
ncbi:uncharacterized protein [Miscanthus floridulus]|uniref:uncharacterized protein isoform X3 n=1 Tax=Miscanthus floridulus TaxID=154761 RepID=UPI00345A0280